ncbi:hypothetical protein AVEN_129588-1 [Araneus ventricosus]|uniref:Uncharacterized protein n=1 Tax=Araneus ventricosus TaxID=182803 RepID=A0A4Y2U4D8_ARAVE|nr:hypothetical protein AVEN_129588-1 [Araneus ventricosus]
MTGTTTAVWNRGWRSNGHNRPRPNPSKEVHPVIGVEITLPHTITIPAMEERPRSLLRCLLNHELVAPPCGIDDRRKQYSISKARQKT